MSKLRKSGYLFPESVAKVYAISAVQEVVKAVLLQKPEPSSTVERNVSIFSYVIATKMVMENITQRLYYGADEKIIQNTLRCNGEIKHVW